VGRQTQINRCVYGEDMSNKLRRYLSAWLFAAAIVCAPLAHAQQAGETGQAKPDSAQAQADLDKAKQFAGTTWALEQHVICDLPTIPPAVDPGPQKLFDNLYAIPGPYSAANGVIYLITTSAGIMEIDTGAKKDVETIYLPGMKKLGLDPADVKTVIIAHGHADHFGGAPYIQEHFHPRIYMSGPDWDFVQLVPPPAQQNQAPPKVDQFVVDGQPIVLGDEKVTPVLIPGHTPGSLGLIFPVKEGGKTHMVGMVGGGMLPQGTPDQMRVFLHSLAQFEEWTKKMKVDVELQNHPIMDGFADKLAALHARKPGDPNPFIVGAENYSKFLDVMYTCVQVYIDRHSD
jgi:metallo-beta-lactamase class B